MPNDERAFRTSRELPHPPEAVWAAFASAKDLATWWGPDGFRNTFEVFDFRVGGRWHLVMHGPDGASHPNQNVFTELDPTRKVVIRHDCAPYFTLTLTLQATPRGTQLDWLQVFDDAQVAQAVRSIVAPANEQNLNRLQRVLDARFVVTHAKDAVFERGLRSFFEYRDLGIQAATQGQAVAHVIRAAAGTEYSGQRHWHDVSFQMVYVLKGWIEFEYEGQGAVRLEAGSCVHQPPGIRHREIGHSPDVEMLEIVMPGEFRTHELS